MKDCCKWSSQFGVQGVLDALVKREDDELKNCLSAGRKSPPGENSDVEAATGAIDEQNASVTATDPCRFCRGSDNTLTTPLHIAAENGVSREAIGLLLSDAGASYSFLSARRYFDQRTPLSVAVSAGSAEAAMALIDATVSNSTLSDEVLASPLLHEAAQRGMSNVVDALCSLSEACDLDVSVDRVARVCGGLLTPLECALRSGAAGTARCLLDRGADARIGRPLLWAVRSGGDCCRLDMTELLLEGGCEVNMVLDDESNPTTPLLCASSLARSNVIDMLLKLGANVDDRGIGGRNPLATYLCAVRHRPSEIGDLAGVLNILRLLSAESCSLTSQDEMGRTALHHALVQYRRLPCLTDVLSALLSNGDVAKEAVNVADHDGVTPLHLALTLNSRALPPDLAATVTTMLLDAGADPNGCNGAMSGPPLLAALCNERNANVDTAMQLRLAEILLRHGAHADEGDTIRTPLMAALLDNDKLEVALSGMNLLIENGANINALNRHGETALHRCMKVFCAKNEWKLIEELLLHGADPNLCDTSGYNALHIAAQRMSARGIHLLLRFGAHVGARTHQGDTALHLLGRQPSSHGIDLHQDLPAAFSLLILAGCPTMEVNQLGTAPLDHLTRTWIRCAELADRLINKPLMLRDMARAKIRLLLHPSSLDDVQSVLGDVLPTALCTLLEGEWLPEREVGGLISDDDDDDDDDDETGADFHDDDETEADFQVEAVDEDDEDDEDDTVQFDRSADVGT